MTTLQENIDALRKELAEKETLLEKQKSDTKKKEKQSWKHNFDILQNIYVGHVINIQRIENKYNKPIHFNNRWEEWQLKDHPHESPHLVKREIEQRKKEAEKMRLQQEQERNFKVNQYKDKHKFNYNEAVFKCFQRLDEILKKKIYIFEK